MKHILSLIVISVYCSALAQFGPPQPIVQGTFVGVSRFLVGDLDGDAAEDILTVFGTTGSLREVTWCKATPAIDQEPRHRVALLSYNPTWLKLADPDNDQDLDVVCISANGKSVAWYENNGSGGGWGYRSAFALQSTIADVVVADADHDGKQDILCALYAGTVSFFRGTGGGVFSAELILASGQTGSTRSFLADLDNDGNLDAAFATSTELRWCKGGGNGMFLAAASAAPLSANDAHTVMLVDLDGDGDTDLLDRSSSTNAVRWMQNTGVPPLSAPQVLFPSTNANNMLASDLTGDGLPDLLFELRSIGFAYARNIGSGSFQVTPGNGGASSASSWASVDMDNDGDRDVLFSKDGEAGWVENYGGGWIGQDLVMGATSVFSRFEAADMDGDGLRDVVSIYNNYSWVRNLGNGDFASKIDLGIAQSEHQAWADLDGDGDADLIYNASGGARWKPNIGSGSLGAEIVIAAAQKIRAMGDINGDGDQDLVVDHTVHSNNGSGAFTATHTIPGAPPFPNSSTGSNLLWRLTDMDGDGDGDMVVHGYERTSLDQSNYHTRWYRNNGPGAMTSLGSSPGQQGLGTPALVLIDLDRDGLRDFVTVDQIFQTNQYVLYWNRNLGTGVSSFRTALINDYNSISLAGGEPAERDLNGDGFMDWLGAGVYAMNLGPMALSRPLPGPYGSELVEDLDGDGVLELYYVNGNDLVRANAQGDDPISRPFEPTAQEGMIYADDTDGDGDKDIIGPTRFLLNMPGTAFATQDLSGQLLSGMEVRAFGNVDADGVKDLVIAGNRTLMWKPGLGGGLYDAARPIGLTNVQGRVWIEDMDGDGDNDLVVAGDYNSNWALLLFKQLGNGVWGLSLLDGSSPSGGYAVEWIGDIDADGDKDMVFVPWSSGGNVVLGKNNGTGTLTKTTVTTVPYGGIAVADVDGDGDVDIAAKGSSNAMRWISNTGNGVYSGSTAMPISSSFNDVLFHDHDGDGDLDAVYREGNDLVRCFLNNAAGTAWTAMGWVSNLFNPQPHSVDVDDDGKPDLIGTNPYYTGDNTVFWMKNLSGGCQLNIKVFLEGPYDQATQTMTTQLGASSLLPVEEPYTALGYTYIGGANRLGVPSIWTNTFVDWVIVEVRSAVFPHTVLRSSSELLLSNGYLNTLWLDVPPGPYRIAVRHRNHLGVMTGTDADLSLAATTIDFTLPGTSVYGTGARRSLGGRELLWAGDISRNGVIKYTGANNDRDKILTAIGGGLGTNVLTGQYRLEDVNLDGVVKYVGENNDRDPILVNVGGTTPTNTRTQQLP